MCRSRIYACLTVVALILPPAVSAAPARRASAGPPEAPAASDACGGGVVTHGSRRRPDIALTFDACPTSHVPPFSADIVASLLVEHVPATFFISGRWAEAHPGELGQLAAVPFFEIAMHGYKHPRLEGAPSATILSEIEGGRQALTRLGVPPQPLFRPPYGDQPATLVATARHAGVTPITWDVAPGDPSPQETAADIERDVLRSVKNGSIIILHVNGRGVGTAAALPRLLPRLRERGFRFVTVSELLRECAPPAETAAP